MGCRLEICCADIESVLAAKEGGADRIELCSALETGGLTPSSGLISEAVSIFGGDKVNVLIRPRPGDFVYSAPEFRVIERDIEEAVRLGAGGIVAGALSESGEIEMKHMKSIRSRFPGVTFTFHRAFDLATDPLNALENVVSMGFNRILTSGQAPDALAGATLISQLVENAEGRIDIMAGSGVSQDNITEIISRTGVKDIHASAKIVTEPKNKNSRKGIAMGTADGDDYCRLVTSAEKVAKLKTLS